MCINLNNVMDPTCHGTTLYGQYFSCVVHAKFMSDAMLNDLICPIVKRVKCVHFSPSLPLSMSATNNEQEVVPPSVGCNTIMAWPEGDIFLLFPDSY